MGKLLIWIGIGALAIGGFVHSLRIAGIDKELETALEAFPSKIELYSEVSSGINSLNTIPPFLFSLYAAGFISISSGALIAYCRQSANRST